VVVLVPRLSQQGAASFHPNVPSAKGCYILFVVILNIISSPSFAVRQQDSILNLHSLAHPRHQFVECRIQLPADPRPPYAMLLSKQLLEECTFLQVCMKTFFAVAFTRDARKKAYILAHIASPETKPEHCGSTIPWRM
jgi:hypothetical protein